MQLPVADTKKRKLKVWKAAEAVWRKALKLSIRVKWMEKDFTCRLQSYSLGHVWGGKSLDMTPEEELWQAVIPRLTLSSLPICTYCILVTVWGWTVLCLKKKKVTLCLLMSFIFHHNVKWTASKTYHSSKENATREYLALLTAQTWQQRSQHLLHQRFNKSFLPAENYYGVQTLAYLVSSLCCVNKILTQFLSFQYRSFMTA